MATIEDIIRENPDKSRIFSARLSVFNNGAIPDELFSFERLPSLSLQGKGLSKLDPRIAEFTRLKRLRITDSKLSELPKEIGALSRLELLYLESDLLHKIPASAGNLKQLKKLSISAPLQDIPKELKKLKSLTELSLIQLELDHLPDFLAELPKLESLKIIGWPNLKNISGELLSKLAKLTSLEISNCPIVELPLGLFDAVNLKYLTARKLLIKSLPKGFKGAPMLCSLDLNDNPNLSDLPPSLTRSKLHNLSICNCAFRQIPDSVYNLRLNRLYANKNQLTSIDPKIVKMQELQFLSLENNQLKSLPKELAQLVLAKLRSLKIEKNAFDSAPINFRHFKRLPATLSIDKELLLGLTIKQFGDFVTRFGSSKQAPELYLPYLAIAAQNNEQVEKLDAKFLLKALNSKLWDLPSIALNYLIHYKGYSIKDRPLQKGAVVAVLGKVEGKKTDWRDKLKAVGLVYATKISKKTTHVLISPNTKNIEDCGDWNWAWISQQQLKEYIETVDTPYLLEKQDASDLQNLQHLKNLFENKDESNIQLALELMEGGGLPDEMITPLFLKYTFSENTDLRRRLRKLLRSKASPAFQAILKKNTRLTPKIYCSRGEFRTYVERLKKHKCLDFNFAELCYNIGQRWHRYEHFFIGIGLDNSSAKEQVPVLKRLIKLGELDCRRNYQFDNFPKGIFLLKGLKRLRIHISEHYEGLELPEEFHKLPNIELLHFQNYLIKIPDLTKLPKLHTLILPILGKESAFESLLQLNQTNVSTLGLSCSTKAFNSDFARSILPQLRKIKTFNFVNYFEEIPTILQHLKQVESMSMGLTKKIDFTPLLQLNQTNVTELNLSMYWSDYKETGLPKVFQQLTNLKKLKLSDCTEEELLTPLRDALPNCEILS